MNKFDPLKAVREELAVECPCCHGTAYLNLVEYDGVDRRPVLTRSMCCHCMGAGVMPTK